MSSKRRRKKRKRHPHPGGDRPVLRASPAVAGGSAAAAALAQPAVSEPVPADDDVRPPESSAVTSPAAVDDEPEPETVPELDQGALPETETETEPAPALDPTSVAEPPPPYAMLKGLVLGLVLFLPLVALASYLLGKIGVGQRNLSYERAIAFAAVFAGVPAVLSAAGIARAAARASVGPRGSLRRTLVTAALESAVAGTGLVLLTVVPLGEVPTAIDHWSLIVVLGALTGAAGGLVLGLWVKGGQPGRSHATSR